MEPTLQVGDRILVDKLSYHLHGVDRGDIVVFRRPADENCGGPPVADLVKRVIGLPGETISLVQGLRRTSTASGSTNRGSPTRSRGRPPGPPGAVQPGQALRDPRQPLLRHGRQPDRLLRQPLLGPDRPVPHRGQGGSSGSGRSPTSTSSDIGCPRRPRVRPTIPRALACSMPASRSNPTRQYDEKSPLARSEGTRMVLSRDESPAEGDANLTPASVPEIGRSLRLARDARRAHPRRGGRPGRAGKRRRSRRSRAADVGHSTTGSRPCGSCAPTPTHSASPGTEYVLVAVEQWPSAPTPC